MKVKKLLISQPAPISDKSPFSELISNCQVEIDFRPFTRVEGVTLKEFRAQRIDIADYTAVIFTSRKTVDNFFRICDEARIQVSEEMKYFCVNETIALYLQKYIVYRKRKIFFGTGTFAALMDVVAKHKQEKYLVALSNPHKPEIEQLMTKTGVKYAKVILANTVPADLSDIPITKYDLVACYSSADIRSVKQHFGEPSEKTIVAVLGNATAREAVLEGIRVDIVAPTPEYPSMTMAIEGYIKALSNGGSLEVFAYREEAKEAEEKEKPAAAKKKPAATNKKAAEPAKKKATAAKASAAKTPKKPAGKTARKAI